MKKILIPTDFTVESLQLIEYAILNYPDTKLDIILVAGYKLPHSRWAMVHFNEREQVRKQLKYEFTTAKHRLIREYKKNINSIKIELFTGKNAFAFNNFLEQLDINDTIVPKGKSLRCSNNKWFDTTKLLRKSVKNVLEVPVDPTSKTTAQNFSLVNIFNQ